MSIKNYLASWLEVKAFMNQAGFDNMTLELAATELLISHKQTSLAGQFR